MSHNIVWFSGTKNTGDLIGPWLASKILNKPLVTNPYKGPNSVALCGSILPCQNHKINWGTGLLSGTKINGGKIIKAVRGPFTRKYCIASGYNPKTHPGLNIYCDPGLSVSRFYNPLITKKYKLGIIPHYVDKKFVDNLLKNYNLEDYGITILDIQTDVDDFVEKLLECETTVSSSLHGIILSVSYGLPTRWVQMGNRLAGNNVKFYDFFLSLICPTINSVNYDQYLSILSRYIAKQITQNQVVQQYEILSPFFNINLTTSTTPEELLNLPHTFTFDESMVDRLLEVFPTEYIKF